MNNEHQDLEITVDVTAVRSIFPLIALLTSITSVPPSPTLSLCAFNHCANYHCHFLSRKKGGCVSVHGQVHGKHRQPSISSCLANAYTLQSTDTCNSLRSYTFHVYLCAWELCFSLEESTVSAVYSTDVSKIHLMHTHMILGHSIYCWRKVKLLLRLHYKKRGSLYSLRHIHRHTHPFWNFPALIISICLKLYETARSCWFEQNVNASFFFFLFSPPLRVSLTLTTLCSTLLPLSELKHNPLFRKGNLTKSWETVGLKDSDLYWPMQWMQQFHFFHFIVIMNDG